MATESDKPKKRRHKMPETVRERVNRPEDKSKKRDKKISKRFYKPLTILSQVGKKEYNPISVPNNRAGRILGKRVKVTPNFIKNAWSELKKVTWPTPKVALKLTLSVVVFAVIFAIFVQIFGYGFERLFEFILID